MVSTKVWYHFSNYLMARAILIKVMSRYSKRLLCVTTYSIWWKMVELAFLSQKSYEIEGKVNYKVTDHHQFSQKRDLVDINAKNRMLKMQICL